MHLGLDIGTSGLRGVLMDEGGAVLGAAERTYDVAHPHPGWSEQDPADWIAACRGVVADLREAHPQAMAALEGIGLSGQMHGATLLGADHEPLRPCMLWNDTRAHEEAARLDTADARRISGNVVFPGFTAPKVAWVAAHEPEVFGRAALVLLPKDHLRLWLTGEAVSDMSDAAGTAWLDVGARAWSDALLDAGGMGREQMPRLVEGSQVSGTLRAAVAEELGIPVVPVAGGGGDNAAAAAGLGTLAEGQGFVSLGTSGVVLAARDRFAPMPETAVHSFCHAIPDTWYQMAVILAATDALSWLARLLGRTPGDLASAMPDHADGPGPVRFAPYLSGERTPHNDAAIRGAFHRLDVAHGAEDLTRAVMEGVAFALRDGLDALRSAGAAPERLTATGGGARSAFWLDTLANALGLPVDVPEAGEIGAALGAARLSACAAGAAPSEVMTPPAIARTVEPREALRAAYADAHATHQASYSALRSIGRDA
jgi:xylulokinase